MKYHTLLKLGWASIATGVLFANLSVLCFATAHGGFGATCVINTVVLVTLGCIAFGFASDIPKGERVRDDRSSS